MKNLTENMKKREKKCLAHGDYEEYSMIHGVWSGCPGCNKDEQEARDIHEATERQKEREKHSLEVRLNRSMIPERFLERTLENYNPENEGQKKALQISREYALDIEGVCERGSSMVFSGKPGTGKTHLAIGIAQHAITEKNKTALFITVMKAIRRIKATWDKGSEEKEQEALDLFSKPDLLILDEVGVQFGSKTEEDLLFDIINTRYEMKKPTIIISNKDLAGIREYLGERAFDRLREDGGQHIAFTWDSYRGK